MGNAHGIYSLIALLQVNLAKTASRQAEQDPNLPRSAGYVLGRVKLILVIIEWWGRWKCRQVNLRGC